MILILTGANQLLGVKDGIFDGHAHVFKATLPLSADRRYTPAYNALLEDYVGHLKESGLNGGLFVQPSFLGTDNRYLLETLERASDFPDLLFKGVAVVDPQTSHAELAKLAELDIIGIRFNLIRSNRYLPFDPALWYPLLQFADQHNWHIELHCEGNRVSSVLKDLLRHSNRVVVDHFGLPDPTDPLQCPGFTSLISAPTDTIFIKISAPYRVFQNKTADEAAEACHPLFNTLLQTYGPDRLVWGSDWPWTQFETGMTYKRAYGWLESWEKDS